MFGENYEQVYFYEQLEHHNSVIHKYADKFVQQIMQEALDIVKMQHMHSEHANVGHANFLLSVCSNL